MRRAFGDHIDTVVDAVREDLLQRSRLGIVKYGTTLDENTGDLRAWLQHAYEECLDQANYLKCAIMTIDNGSTAAEEKNDGDPDRPA